MPRTAVHRRATADAADAPAIKKRVKAVARGEAKRAESLPCGQFWAGAFGDDYTNRNQVDWKKRVPFLRRILEVAPATSFLDVGCNAGWNLLALREIVGNERLTATGIDVNQKALEQAAAEGLDVIFASALQCCDDPLSIECAEMVMTSGVLIHVPPAELTQTLRAIRDASMQYVLAIEYASVSGAEEAIEYRGHEGRLWRRDFGKCFVDLGGLELIETGEAPGFEDCRYWLLEKVA